MNENVVHCHECMKNWTNPDSGKLWCKSPMGAMGCVMVKPDDFCSRGERKVQPE